MGLCQSPRRSGADGGGTAHKPTGRLCGPCGRHRRQLGFYADRRRPANADAVAFPHAERFAGATGLSVCLYGIAGVVTNLSAGWVILNGAVQASAPRLLPAKDKSEAQIIAAARAWAGALVFVPAMLVLLIGHTVQQRRCLVCRVSSSVTQIHPQCRAVSGCKKRCRLAHRA